MTIIHSFFKRTQGKRTVEIHVMDEVDGAPQALPGPTIKRTRPERPTAADIPNRGGNRHTTPKQEPFVEPEVEYKHSVDRGEGIGRTARAFLMWSIVLFMCVATGLFIFADWRAALLAAAAWFIAAHVISAAIRVMSWAMSRLTR